MQDPINTKEKADSPGRTLVTSQPTLPHSPPQSQGHRLPLKGRGPSVRLHTVWEASMTPVALPCQLPSHQDRKLRSEGSCGPALLCPGLLSCPPSRQELLLPYSLGLRLRGSLFTLLSERPKTAGPAASHLAGSQILFVF